MNSKSCDTCKEDVDDYDHGGYKDFGEHKDEIMCIECVQEYKKDFPLDWSEAEKDWLKATVIEKAYYTTKGNITGSVVVFTDTQLAPKWEDIKETDQWVLLQVMTEVKGA